MHTLTDDAPNTQCAHCPRLLRHNELHRLVCYVCEERATDQLQAMPDLYDQLARVLRPGAVTRNAGHVTGATRTPPLPVSLQALNLRGPGGVVSVLMEIEQRWRIQLDWDHLPSRGGYEKSLAGTVKFLANNMRWACGDYEEIAYDLDTISSLHNQAQQTVTGYRPRLIPVTCLAQYDDGTECGAQIRMDINRTSVLCLMCGTRWGRDDWVRLYEATNCQPAA
ncbi:hypothetical protein [Kitasatospora sp. NPDC127116]|uniref:hypothetical protein n=1 Tax=Kitasatospora sp. NPDC127116 TaxID=3345367 RepID=UPI00363A0F00